MVCKTTLKIKNLPKELSDAQKEDFVRHFGATKVNIITSRVKEKSVVYAKFDSEEIAKTVLFRLHQLTILNCVLCVQYAENDLVQSKPNFKKIEDTNTSSTKFFKTFISKLSSFNDSVGFHQPPPSHLKYLYPKANRATINNIAHALATIPRFYTQVLHLMNRMNLPPPFAVEQPPVRTITPVAAIQKPVEKPHIQQQMLPAQSTAEPPSKLDVKSRDSSSESELESDGEDQFRSKEYIPVKRKISQNKAIKRPKFIRPQAVPNQNIVQKTGEKPEDVFEKTEVQVAKKIELKVSSDALEQIKPEIHPEKVNIINMNPMPLSQTLEKPEETPAIPESQPEREEKSVITEEELAANRIPHKDLGVLPVFKNYHPGAPTSRLYIKNCAKTVVTQDLEYIFNRYRVPESDAPSQFDIRLMQEGRMKGQAFITLDNVELAQKALKETNGYVLKEKPLVVVFARSAVPKKT